MKNKYKTKLLFLTILSSAVLIFVSSCNNKDMQEPSFEKEEYGKFKAEQIIYDESGKNYIVNDVYADDASVLDDYLKGDYNLAPADTYIANEESIEEELGDSLTEDVAPSINVISIPKELKLGKGYENGYQIDVRPNESDLRWNYTPLLYGFSYYRKFKVNRHTGWHRVKVASWYQDDQGGVDQEEEGYTNVPNNAASIGYNRCYDDVFRWTIQIQYRKSKHYSYNFYYTCN